IISQTGTTLNLYLYSGEQLDPNVGLYYLRARYYSGSSGRFTTADTYQGSPFDPLTLHLYTYAANDPVLLIDPSGQFSIPELMAAVTIQQILQQYTLTHV